jgi:hypothetical protein
MAGTIEHSLTYLAPSDRPAAFGELARVVKPAAIW